MQMLVLDRAGWGAQEQLPPHPWWSRLPSPSSFTCSVVLLPLAGSLVKEGDLRSMVYLLQLQLTIPGEQLNCVFPCLASAL